MDVDEIGAVRAPKRLGLQRVENHRAGIGAVRLDSERLDAMRLRCLYDLRGPIRRTGKRQCDVRAFTGKTLDDRGSDAAATAGDESDFTPKSIWCIHLCQSNGVPLHWNPYFR